jgi:hypothetical protein
MIEQPCVSVRYGIFQENYSADTLAITIERCKQKARTVIPGHYWGGFLPSRVF